MKSLLATLILMVLLPALMLAEDHGVQVFADRVTTGSLVWTNADEGVSYELRQVAFKISDASYANTFTIQHAVNFRPADTFTTQVITNEVTGTADTITTNTIRQIADLVQITNSYAVATVTNDNSTQYYDVDDFPKDWHFKYGDVSTFTWSYSSTTVDVIRTYNVYKQP